MNGGWGCPECGHAKAGHDERGCPARECSYRFAAVAARPAGEDAPSPVPDDVREEIAQILLDWAKALVNHGAESPAVIADAVLATPALRRYLDAAAAVERVRELADGTDPHAHRFGYEITRDIYRALDGEP